MNAIRIWNTEAGTPIRLRFAGVGTPTISYPASGNPVAYVVRDNAGNAGFTQEDGTPGDGILQTATASTVVLGSGLGNGNCQNSVVKIPHCAGLSWPSAITAPALLDNTVVHEFGHVLGLGHVFSCGVASGCSPNATPCSNAVNPDVTDQNDCSFACWAESVMAYNGRDPLAMDTTAPFNRTRTLWEWDVNALRNGGGQQRDEPVPVQASACGNLKAGPAGYGSYSGIQVRHRARTTTSTWFSETDSGDTTTTTPAVAGGLNTSSNQPSWCSSPPCEQFVVAFSGTNHIIYYRITDGNNWDYVWANNSSTRVPPAIGYGNTTSGSLWTSLHVATYDERDIWVQTSPGGYSWSSPYALNGGLARSRTKPAIAYNPYHQEWIAVWADATTSRITSATSADPTNPSSWSALTIWDGTNFPDTTSFDGVDLACTPGWDCLLAFTDFQGDFRRQYTFPAFLSGGVFAPYATSADVWANSRNVSGLGLDSSGRYLSALPYFSSSSSSSTNQELWSSVKSSWLGSWSWSTRVQLAPNSEGATVGNYLSGLGKMVTFFAN